ncbi:MAG: hypothetical protein M5U30_16880 [Burkholderiaceae bacterium]|nr:hypothetical protein [Burkholderiaceae bacterium]
MQVQRALVEGDARLAQPLLQLCGERGRPGRRTAVGRVAGGRALRMGGADPVQPASEAAQTGQRQRGPARIDARERAGQPRFVGSRALADEDQREVDVAGRQRPAPRLAASRAASAPRRAAAAASGRSA